MAVRKGLLQIHDFTVEGAGDAVFDIPAGHTYVSVKCAVTVQSMFIHLSTGGTADSIDYRFYEGNQDTSTTVDVTGPGIGMKLADDAESVAVNGTGMASLWNMNTAAPVIAFVSPLDDGGSPAGSARGYVFKSIAPQNQIVVSGGLTVGKVYVQSYKRTVTVESQEFTTPAATWDIENLKHGDGNLIVVSSYDLTVSVSAGVHGLVSTDGGSTFDTGASDYRLNWTADSSGNVVDQAKLFLNQSTGTTIGVCSIIAGMPLLTRSQLLNRGMTPSGVTSIQGVCIVNTRQIEDTLQIFATASTFNGGTIYASRYKL